jgi:hypothetical protein
MDLRYIYRPLVRYAAAFIIIVIGGYTIIAQEPIIGEWKANARLEKPESADVIFLSIVRKNEAKTNQTSKTFKYADLQGLSRSQTENGRVSFQLIRDAGRLDLEGQFTNGKGEGTFRFTPDMAFANALTARGFSLKDASGTSDTTIEERLYTAAILDVKLALADDLAAANLGKLDFNDLVKATIFKIDGKYISEMKATGFPDLSMEDLVKGRIFKMDANFVRGMAQAGHTAKGFDGLVKFAIFKVTPEFSSELRSAGLNDVTDEDIVKFRIFKIDADFVREARQSDPNVTVEEIVRRKLGVHRNKASQ